MYLITKIRIIICLHSPLDQLLLLKIPILQLPTIRTGIIDYRLQPKYLLRHRTRPIAKMRLHQLHSLRTNNMLPRPGEILLQPDFVFHIRELLFDRHLDLNFIDSDLPFLIIINQIAENRIIAIIRLHEYLQHSLQRKVSEIRMLEKHLKYHFILFHLNQFLQEGLPALVYNTKVHTLEHLIIDELLDRCPQQGILRYAHAHIGDHQQYVMDII